MVSAERVMAYCKLKPEASLDTEPESAAPDPDWPSKGEIELNDVSYQHSPKGPFVLQGISCLVEARHKVSGFSGLQFTFNLRYYPRSSMKSIWSILHSQFVTSSKWSNNLVLVTILSNFLYRRVIKIFCWGKNKHCIEFTECDCIPLPYFFVWNSALWVTVLFTWWKVLFKSFHIGACGSRLACVSVTKQLVILLSWGRGDICLAFSAI